MKTIGIVPNYDKPAAMDFVKDIAEYIKKMCIRDRYGIAVIIVILIVIVILILRNKRKNRYKIKGNYSSRGKYDTSRINAKKRRRRGDRDKYNKYR